MGQIALYACHGACAQRAGQRAGDGAEAGRALRGGGRRGGVKQAHAGREARGRAIQQLGRHPRGDGGRGRHPQRAVGGRQRVRVLDVPRGGREGVAPPELVEVQRVRCDAQRPNDTSALQVRRYDPATGRMALVATRAVQGATPESSHVGALDVTGSPVPEILLCATPLGSGMVPRTCRLFAFTAPGSLSPVPDATNPFVWSSPARRSILASVLVDDLDGDGAREVFVQSQEHVDVLRGPRR